MKKKKMILAFFLPFTSLFLPDAHAQQWEQKDMGGRDYSLIQSFTASGNHLVMGINDKGIYTSFNGGDTWQNSNNGIAETGSFSIPSILNIGNSLYAMTYKNGRAKVYVSNNKGENWQQMTTLASEENINRIFSDGYELYASSTTSLYKYNLAENTWKKTSFSIQPISGEIVALQKYEGVLYVSTTKNGLHASNDKGITWKKLAGGGIPIQDGNPITINDIVAGNGYLYAGTETGLYASSDKGYNWIRLTTTPVRSLLFNLNTIYVGNMDFSISYSTNNGLNWENYEQVGLIPTKLGITKNELIAANNGAGLRRLRLPNSEIINETGSIEIYPNPITKTSSFNFRTLQEGEIQFNLMNTLGETLISGKQSVSKGGNILNINTDQLTNGIYIFEVISSGTRITNQLIINN